MKKTFSNIKTKVVGTAVLSMVSASSAIAQVTQYKDAKSLINDLSIKVHDTGEPIVNLMLFISALVAAILIVWGYVRHGKGDSGANDALAKVGVGFLITAGVLLIVKIMFFK